MLAPQATSVMQVQAGCRPQAIPEVESPTATIPQDTLPTHLPFVPAPSAPARCSCLFSNYASSTMQGSFACWLDYLSLVLHKYNMRLLGNVVRVYPWIIQGLTFLSA